MEDGRATIDDSELKYNALKQRNVTNQLNGKGGPRSSDESVSASSPAIPGLNLSTSNNFQMTVSVRRIEVS